MERFDDFIKERIYLKGVSAATIEWYKDAFDAWRRYGNGEPKQFVIAMRQAGIKPVSCNSWICAMNAYWKWEGAGIKLGYLKEEQKILSTFSPEQVSRLIHWKPVGRNFTRAHVIALIALDTGLRISELLRLSREDVNLDNLVLRVHGKGNKQRLVPIALNSARSCIGTCPSTRSRCCLLRPPELRCPFGIRNEILRSCAGRLRLRGCGRRGIQFIILLRLIICGLAGICTTCSEFWGTRQSRQRSGICGVSGLRIYNVYTTSYRCCRNDERKAQTRCR